MSTRPLLLLLLLLIASPSCHEREGACPEVLAVDPGQAGSEETVTVTGRDFALGHTDLFGDPQAVPPSVTLDVSMRDTVRDFEFMFTPEELASMEAMDMSLNAGPVAFRSSEELEVTLPELAWSDLTSAAEMFGAAIPELPSFITEISLSSTLSVANPSGCQAAWGETFGFVVQIESEADADADADADGDVDADADADGAADAEADAEGGEAK